MCRRRACAHRVGMTRPLLMSMLAVAISTACSPGPGTASASSASSVSTGAADVSTTAVRLSRLVGDGVDDVVVDVRAGGVVALTYDDVGGASRTVLAEVRWPSDHTGPVPVVVWSHGGSSGKRSTARVGVGWGRAFTNAGVAFVAIAHPGRDMESRFALCDALGVHDCSMFKYLDWDRPADVDVVLDWLSGAAADGDGRSLDLDRLAYGGHSAGARSVLRVAGVDLPIPGDRQVEPDARFGAFLVASPPGAESLDITAASFDGLESPLLMLSGAGDVTNANQALDRRATMGLLPDGPFAAIWVDDEHTRHTTFNLDRDSCERAGGTRARCSEIVRGLARAGTVFVDVALGGRSIDEFVAAAPRRLPSGFVVR